MQIFSAFFLSNATSYNLAFKNNFLNEMFANIDNFVDLMSFQIIGIFCAFNSIPSQYDIS